MSTRKVTGDALNRILTASKEYIDSRDIDFQGFNVDPDTGELIDPDTGIVIKDLSLCDHDNIYEDDVDNLLKEIFNK